MSAFYTDYRVAYDAALTEARKTGRIMQLLATKELGNKGFRVGLSVQNPSQRFGRDSEGEFIEPSAPVVA